MITLTFAEARETLARVLDSAREEPVTIIRPAAPDMVVITAAYFAELQLARLETSVARVMNPASVARDAGVQDGQPPVQHLCGDRARFNTSGPVFRIVPVPD